ncbi:MAG: DAK2 domain-containing protein, partial [Chloroflexota bacterium]|nr:DAK2 domain-containing protein [Chloroflexota bacterium]
MTERSVRDRSLVTRRSWDGDALQAAFAAAVANLEAYVDEINELNVFPVPDGDTGSNMLATVGAALDEARRSTERSADRVAGAISFGARMGARGNSGVILSQILNGMARAIAGKERIDGPDLAQALGVGTEAAYAAVKNPIEGTILTVIREAAAAAALSAGRADDIETVLAATVTAADRAVASTTDLLPILREAGVVDSGGQGLYRLLEGALQYVVGERQVGAVSTEGRSAAKPASAVAKVDEGYGYETMFLLQPSPGRGLDIEVIRDRLGAMGDSVLVAGDAQAAKVHIHSERPDEVIALGLGLGKLSRITVENLDEQVRDVHEVRAAQFTAPTPGGDSVVDLRVVRPAAAVASARNGTRPKATAAQTGRTTFAPGVRAGERRSLAVVVVAAG